MEVQLKLPKGISLPIGNAMRQIAMSRLPAWRPIAIALDREFNTLHSTADIPEDIPSVMASITPLLFIPKHEIQGEFLKEKFTFKKVLRTSDLNSEHFTITGEDNVILTCLNEDEVTLTIIYRYASGGMNYSDNVEFIGNHGERADSYMVFNSRHTDIRNFSFDIREASLLYEVLELKVESDTRNESDILNETLDILKRNVEEVQNILKTHDPEFYNEKTPSSQKIIGVTENQ